MVVSGASETFSCSSIDSGLTIYEENDGLDEATAEFA
jgi:hypothetical protein